MVERRICPLCGKPIWEDATEAERQAQPPNICSPLRCSAWKKIGVLRSGGRSLRLVQDD